MSGKKREQVIKELHKPARRRYPRRKVVIKGWDDLWQADLVEMIPYAQVNQGYRYILMVIDTFTKFLWAVPVKRKTGELVTEAMEKVFKKSKRTPKHLQTDHGTEFYNPHFQKLMKENNIIHYSTFTNMKASIVERVNRTIKTWMWRKFAFNANNKWINLLPQLVARYNQTKHRKTGRKPISITMDEADELYETRFKEIKIVDKVHFKEGTKVRVSKVGRPVHFKVGDEVKIGDVKKVFAKGYLPNWSSEVFTVAKVKRTNPTTYILRDNENELIDGGFYREELQKVMYPNVYIVEKKGQARGKPYTKYLTFEKK